MWSDKEDFSPILFCIIGPGASGKSSLCSAIASERTDVAISVSSTTRLPRPSETDRKDYYFISREAFEAKVLNGDFLEHASFAGNLYGTGRENVVNAASRSVHLLLDIDIQGVQHLKQLSDYRVVTVFVCPPSLDEMIERFRRRGGDSEERIAERVRIAREEVSAGLAEGFSDYLIVNRDLEESSRNLQAIIEAESLRVGRKKANACINHFLTA